MISNDLPYCIHDTAAAAAAAAAADARRCKDSAASKIARGGASNGPHS